MNCWRGERLDVDLAERTIGSRRGSRSQTITQSSCRFGMGCQPDPELRFTWFWQIRLWRMASRRVPLLADTQRICEITERTSAHETKTETGWPYRCPALRSANDTHRSPPVTDLGPRSAPASRDPDHKKYRDLL